MRRRSREEFEACFRAQYPSVVRCATVIVGDRGVAEEVTQDAFLKLYERWAVMSRVVDNPAAWVHRVAVRAAVRRAARERMIPVAELADNGVVDAVPDVDLMTAVAGLPPGQRAAVALYYLEDRPVDEVAALMGVSSSTVKVHLHRARARLAVVLGEEVVGDVG